MKISRHDVRRTFALVLLSAATASGCALAGDEPVQPADPMAAVAHTAQPLQLTYTSGVHMVVEDLVQTPMARSTAALRIRNSRPTAPFGSCGMTFVSRHYGVTAAHCVDHLALNNDRITAEEIWFGLLDIRELLGYMQVYGSSIADFRPGATLRTGYNVRRFSDCRVTRRCDTRFGGKQACPAGIPANQDVDLAMVYCPSRPSGVYAQTTSSLAQMGWPIDIDDFYTVNVNTWWFHEVYDLPTEPDGTNRWAQYGAYRGRQYANQNWHYTREHQLLPLASLTWPNGTYYSSIPSSDPTLNTTDTPACHGTSGSGVFIYGTNYFLGPVSTVGSDSQSNGRLCERFNAVGPGQRLSTYVRGVLTNAFVRNSPEVVADM